MRRLEGLRRTGSSTAVSCCPRTPLNLAFVALGLLVLSLTLPGCSATQRPYIAIDALERCIGLSLGDAIPKLGLTATSHWIVDEPPFHPRGVEFELPDGFLTLYFPMQGVSQKPHRDLRVEDFRDVQVVGFSYKCIADGRVRQSGAVPVGSELP